MALQKAPPVAILACLGFLVTFILFLTAFGSPYWIGSDSVCIHLGLWKICGSVSISGCVKECIDIRTALGITPDYWMATQAMECLALISGFAVNILLLLFIFKKSCRDSTLVLKSAKFSGLATGALSLIAVIIFGAKTHDLVRSSIASDVLGWAYWCAVASSIMFIICAIIAVNIRSPTITPTPMHYNIPMSSAQTQPTTLPVQYVYQTPVQYVYQTPTAAYPSYPSYPPPVQPTLQTPIHDKYPAY